MRALKGVKVALWLIAIIPLLLFSQADKEEEVDSSVSRPFNWRDWWIFGVIWGVDVGSLCLHTQAQDAT